MNDIEKNAFIQSGSAKIIEAIQGCRKRRTAAKQRQEYFTLIEKLRKTINSVKNRCDNNIKIIDTIAINVHDWFQTYQFDKEIKGNIVKILVMAFNQ
jgi:hypothetical protein